MQTGVTELPGWAMAIGSGLVSLAIVLVGALLKRAISDLDDRFSLLSAQIAALEVRLEAKTSVTGEHAVSLGVVQAQLEALEQRLRRLEGESGTCSMEGRIKALEGSS